MTSCDITALLFQVSTSFCLGLKVDPFSHDSCLSLISPSQIVVLFVVRVGEERLKTHVS